MGGSSPLSLARNVILGKSLPLSEAAFLHLELGVGNTYH